MDEQYKLGLWLNIHRLAAKRLIWGQRLGDFSADGVRDVFLVAGMGELAADTARANRWHAEQEAQDG